MSERIRRALADPRRKVRFREVARDIVAKDRHDRKYGLATDTAGEIARALERSYRQGFEDAQMDERSIQHTKTGEPAGAVEWALVPPRPRSAFWTICLFTLGRENQHESRGYLVRATTERGTPGWQLVLSDWDYRDNTIGAKTITPLVRMGLLVAADEDSDRLVISARGRMTWTLFCERGGRFPEDLTSI